MRFCEFWPTLTRRTPNTRSAPLDFELSPLDNLDLTGITIGRVRTEGVVDVELDILSGRDEALKVLETLGAAIKTVDMNGYDAEQLRQDSLLILEAEAASYFGRRAGHQSRRFHAYPALSVRCRRARACHGACSSPSGEPGRAPAYAPHVCRR